MTNRFSTHGQTNNNGHRPVDWEAVYRAQYPRVYNFFRFRVGDGPLAEDLTADTFLRAWGSRERYAPEQGAFVAWLFGIARHVAAMHFRGRRETVALEAVQANLADPSPLGRPERMVVRQLEDERLAALLADLPDREREIVALRYGAELSYREIAALLELSETNVGTILHRTVQQLRAVWETQP
jgi:RNA polymerase sigma-70 factor (ECF subfamily)